ncbi:MFS transporter [Nocardiopsis sp. N85]|uniref:MFS transporter n=1 Tax=Nocardiopsis sp. N85 TaxID=3029400 RepID=UPI00237F50FB|nr:MFS transporter [Nocardiopsis sp. N85]MDE3724180.1 MFS transporter [Nocardiopsis sp. N85]
MKLSRVMVDTSPLRLSREFRIVFTARLISVFGLGFATVALPLQVYGLTGSSLMVATVHTTTAVSVLAGTIIGGLLADRGDRRRFIVIGRASAVIGFGALAADTLVFDTPWLWVIYAAAIVNGLFGSFSAVALQTAAPGFVPPDRLPSAGALPALNAELGSVLASAPGGVVIATWGMGANHVIAAGLSLVTTALVWRLPRLDAPASEEGRRPSVVADLREGTAFTVCHRVVGPLLLLGLVQMLFAAPAVLIPEFTDKVLGGGEAMVGFLYTAPAPGALIGSLTSGWAGRAPPHRGSADPRRRPVRGGGPRAGGVPVGAVGVRLPRPCWGSGRSWRRSCATRCRNRTPRTGCAGASTPRGPPRPPSATRRAPSPWGRWRRSSARRAPSWPAVCRPSPGRARSPWPARACARPACAPDPKTPPSRNGTPITRSNA